MTVAMATEPPRAARLHIATSDGCEFEILGNPRPLHRHRTTVQHGYPRTYDPRENQLSKRDVVLAWRDAGAHRFDRKVALELAATFTFRRPDHHMGTGRNKGTVKPSAPAHHTVTPDASNLVKLIEDALVGLVFPDDSQIAHVTATKRYCDPGELPSTLVTIRPAP